MAQSRAYSAVGARITRRRPSPWRSAKTAGSPIATNTAHSTSSTFVARFPTERALSSELAAGAARRGRRRLGGEGEAVGREVEVAILKHLVVLEAEAEGGGGLGGHRHALELAGAHEVGERRRAHHLGAAGGGQPQLAVAHDDLLEGGVRRLGAAVGRDGRRERDEPHQPFAVGVGGEDEELAVGEAQPEDARVDARDVAARSGRRGRPCPSACG